MATEKANRDRLHKLKEVTDALLVTDISYQESQRHYTQWATSSQDGTYDTLHDHSTYSGPKKMADTMKQIFWKPESALVLDLGAGTGISGHMLVEKGFRNLHALEPCREFVPTLTKKKIYQKVLNECIGRGSVVDAPNETYDAIVASGAYGPGCIPCDSFYEIVRLLKPGGYFVNAMRLEYTWTVPEYLDRLEPLAKLLGRDGRWRQVTWEVYPNHFFDKDGLLMVFQRC